MESKIIYESQFKSGIAAYVCWFLLGCHYAYLNNWKRQWLYWLTLGGLGIWALIDLFRIPTMVRKHNQFLQSFIDELDLKEIEEDRMVAMSMN
ncbi:TM2 domain-containing protein [Persicobacter diffluens]|uniref:TM2 domain-containing protein n=1 Tax=Persicobacter diffluens TaxID=981 RepID=A0AAN4W0D9_9BACT|nr:hypothetical protein PEDI_38880 [Persicobacter diffluens]